MKIRINKANFTDVGTGFDFTGNIDFAAEDLTINRAMIGFRARETPTPPLTESEKKLLSDYFSPDTDPTLAALFFEKAKDKAPAERETFAQRFKVKAEKAGTFIFNAASFSANILKLTGSNDVLEFIHKFTEGIQHVG